MKERLYKAENHTNRFNVEAFPAHSLQSFRVLAVVVLAKLGKQSQPSQYILNKKKFTNFSDYFFN